jgi:hypothetical protein
VPSVSSPTALRRAAAGFEISGPSLVIEPAAETAVRESLDRTGLVLLGEVHGVRENPLLIRALLRAFGLTRLGLEWPAELAPVIGSFLAGQDLASGHRPGDDLADEWELWTGDGRITAGHLAVLAERTAAGPLELILFDGPVDADWSWSQCDEAMARRVLAASPAGTRTLVVAGSAHTVTHDTDLGTPMGAYLARERPGVTEIRISYGGGSFYNCGPRRFGGGVMESRPVTLAERDGTLVLDLPWAEEAVVPQRPRPAPVIPPWPGPLTL